jgi:transcriptional regulator with XRE-family HTH domain
MINTNKPAPKALYPDMKQIRGWIQSMRLKQNITLKDVSEKTGYTTDELLSIETGAKPMSLVVLFQLLAAIDCDLILRTRNIQRSKKVKQEKFEFRWEDIGNGSQAQRTKR